jgi:hypothetical protein
LSAKSVLKKMVKRMKGTGSIPRKFTAILALAVMSMSGYAADNSIYIDQSGDNATITMTQDGAGNRVRAIQSVGSGNTTPAKIYGDNNQVTVTQTGSGNTLDLGMTTATGTGNPTVSYSITGNNATAIINTNNDGQGTSVSNIIDITQIGNAGNVVVAMLGSQNTLTSLQNCNNNNLTATINGDNNIATISNTGGSGNATTLNQQGDNHTATITTIGATNVTNIDQQGATAGHTATVSINVFELSYLATDTIGVGFAIPEASQLNRTLLPEAVAVIVGETKLKNAGRTAFTG